MRVLICGDRNFTDHHRIRVMIDHLNPGTVVIEGEARGADSMARDFAEDRGLNVLKFPTDWGKYGRGAGPVRNTQMLDEGKPDMVVAFHDRIWESKGTKNMLNQASKRGIPCFLCVWTGVEQIGYKEYTGKEIPNM